MANLFSYHQIYEKTLRSGNPVKERTLSAWHSRAVMTRNALLLAKTQYESDLKELEDTYSAKTFAEKRKEIDNEFSVLTDIARKRVEADLQEVLESKRSWYDKCNSAPSESVTRLLTVLNMRDTLTVEELAAISGKLEGNIPGLRLLRDIAKRHKLSFPDIGNPAEFEQMMTEAEQYSTARLSSIGMTRREIIDNSSTATMELDFWEHGDSPKSKHYALFNTLDRAAFSSEQITALPDEPQKPKPESMRIPDTTSTNQTGKNALMEASDDFWSEITVKTERLSEIARQFHTSEQAIREANPGVNFDSGLHQGQKLYIPSTKFSYSPGSSAYVSEDRVKLVPAVKNAIKTGPNGELPGDDIDIYPGV